MGDIVLNNDETIEDLQIKGLKIIQKKKGFRFGMDAVLLANFAQVEKGDHVLDIGTGTGIIPLLIAAKTEAEKVTGIEIQKHMAEMAQRSVEMNNLQDRIKIINADIREYNKFFKRSAFDVVVCNPPYIKNNGGLKNMADTVAISRHEITCTLEDVISAASTLLTQSGQFVMVHKPERLADILCAMRKYKIEPKFMKFVHPKIHEKPNLVLIRGIKGGNAFLKVSEPLYVYDEKGAYSREIHTIYDISVDGD